MSRVYGFANLEKKESWHEMGAINTKKDKLVIKKPFDSSCFEFRGSFIDYFHSQKGSNPIYQFTNEKLITFSFFALQTWSLSNKLFIPKEIITKILIEMGEIPEAKKSGFTMMHHNAYSPNKVIVFGGRGGLFSAISFY